MKRKGLRRIGRSSFLLLVLMFLLQVSVNSQEKVESKVAPALQAVQTLEPRFRVALDQINERTGFRTVLVQLDQKHFNLCDLKLVFSNIKKTFPALYLTVYAYSDLVTLEAMVKFRINESKGGAQEFESTPEGLAAQVARFREMGHPERLEGRRAIYVRDDRPDMIDQYLDYMPDPESSKFERVILR